MVKKEEIVKGKMNLFVVKVKMKQFVLSIIIFFPYSLICQDRFLYVAVVPGTCSIVNTDLELRDLPVSAPQYW